MSSIPTPPSPAAASPPPTTASTASRTVRDLRARLPEGRHRRLHLGHLPRPLEVEVMVNPRLRHQRRDGDDLRRADVSRRDLSPTSCSNGRPFISINATDINYGSVFAFSQDQFDLICSDLSSFPIASAVAASNGFPVLFTPITLTSYSAQCGGREPGLGSRPPMSGDAGVAPAQPGGDGPPLPGSGEDPLCPSHGWRHRRQPGDAFHDRDGARLRRQLDRIRAVGGGHIRRIILISADGESSRDSRGRRKGPFRVSDRSSAPFPVPDRQLQFRDAYSRQQRTGARRRPAEEAAFAEAPVIDGYPCDDVQGFFDTCPCPTSPTPSSARSSSISPPASRSPARTSTSWWPPASGRCANRNVCGVRDSLAKLSAMAGGSSE